MIYNVEMKKRLADGKRKKKNKVYLANAQSKSVTINFGQRTILPNGRFNTIQYQTLQAFGMETRHMVNKKYPT